MVAIVWFASGLPRTLRLRALSATPGLLVYADETRSSRSFQLLTRFLESSPMPDSLRRFLLQYCEARTSNVVLRGLHPLIAPEQVEPLEGMDIVNFLDLQTGERADEVIELIADKAPNLKILHLEGRVTDAGLRRICAAFPELEDLYLINAEIEGPIPELESGLKKLQGITFASCKLGRSFEESLENRPDVKIARQ